MYPQPLTRHPSEYEPELMTNATLVIAAHVATFPDASAEHFGALSEEATIAIRAINARIDVYRAEIHRRLHDGRMSDGEYAAIYDRVAGARLANDERLALAGTVAV